jgi:hypothetical protein
VVGSVFAGSGWWGLFLAADLAAGFAADFASFKADPVR